MLHTLRGCQNPQALPCRRLKVALNAGSRHRGAVTGALAMTQWGDDITLDTLRLPIRGSAECDYDSCSRSAIKRRGLSVVTPLRSHTIVCMAGD